MNLIDKLFANTPMLIDTEEMVSKPGAKLTYDSMDRQEGAYRVLISTDHARLFDEMTITVYVRPAPNTNLLSWGTMAVVDGTDAQLHGITIPACAGFTVQFDHRSGRELPITVHIWKI